MDIKTFLTLNKDNKKISNEGKKELFYYFERTIKNSFIDLDINYKDLSSYQEKKQKYFYEAKSFK